MKDFYYILGTDRKCTSAELNAAYRKLAEKFRADSHEQDHFLDSHFQEITEAYQILSDPTRRRKYDAAYKKNYQRRLYYFKIKHLNIVATLAFILFIGIFGLYVIKAIKADPVKKAISIKPVALIKQKHHKKKRLAKFTLPVVATKPAVENIVKIQQRQLQPQPSSPKQITTPERAKIEKIPPPTHADAPAVISSTAYYVRANITGLVNLHETANYQSGVVTTIPNHTKVDVLEKGASFYKIAYNGQTGYVPKWTIAATTN